MMFVQKEKTSTQEVPLSRIAFDDASFRMTFCPELSALTTSLRKVGLIGPVILRGKEQYQIVTGYRRIAAAQGLGWEAVRAAVYAPEDLSAAEGFRLNFYENLGTRGFNLIEAAMVVAGFFDICGKEEREVQEEILPVLGFQPGRKILQSLQTLLCLSNAWKERVIKQGISLLNAAKLSSFSSLDQSALYAALSGVKLGENKLRECLEMVVTITQRDKVSVAELFAAEPFTIITQDEKRSSAEKAEWLRKALKVRRYPELTRLEEKFSAQKKMLSLPSQVSLTPPEFFEGDHLQVRFGFRSPKELQAIAQTLGKTAESKTLQEIFELL